MSRGSAFRVALGVLGLLIAAVSWLPWFQHTVAQSSGAPRVYVASAWGASTVWSAAVVFGVAAGIAGLLGGRAIRGKALVLALAVAGFALCVTEAVCIWRLSAEPGTRGESFVVFEPRYSEPLDFGVQRDRLSLLTLDGYSSGFAWGPWVGGALLAVQVLVAAFAVRAPAG